MQIRREKEGDQESIYAVNVSAFETPTEADLVIALGKKADPVISLVAEDEGKIIGHILFSPMTLEGSSKLKLMGLAPMAVIPSRQKKGVGSALVRAGLEECRKRGVDAVFVLGHTEYYPRFGFLPSSRMGIRSEYPVPEEVFMVLELTQDALKGRTGTVKYHPVFQDF